MSAGQTLHLRLYGHHADRTEVLVQLWGEDEAGPDGEVGWTAELAYRPEGAPTWGPPIELRIR